MVKREEDEACRLCEKVEDSTEHMCVRNPALVLLRFQRELGEWTRGLSRQSRSKCRIFFIGEKLFLGSG